ncbi:Peroxisomal biogenesis factor 19 [Paramyrothecium foliicola]|nr:Peroxisomal biogenesis factor 19 [Paramyrothecium foliicola]
MFALAAAHSLGHYSPLYSNRGVALPPGAACPTSAMEATSGPSGADDKVNIATSKPAEVQTSTTATNDAAPSGSGVEDVPDPDEDDLDDLDDMLDDFATVKLDAQKSPTPLDAAQAKPTPKPEATRASAPAPDQDEPFSEEDFAKQLQEGMASLLGELGKSAYGRLLTSCQPDMQAQFEDMFKQMTAEAEAEGGEKPGQSASASASTTGPSSSAQAASEDKSFQETIRRTMERMQTSGDQATAAAASGAGDDFMSEMLKQLSSGDLNGEGSEEEFSKMLMGMMEQLTNKDILYEPMKELHDKFPGWLEKNKAKTPAEDLKRYEEQQTVVAEIVAKFEEKSYSDSNAADREYIVDRMQKMQAAGSPPPDLVGDMESAQDAFNMPDEQCNPQ